ncbi:nucleotide exchange factor GrpE [Nocardia yamanashiensis]|uniref:nucleotide exchange factor GrpE n=1 Tax=Nocardia yamanashiensis TaxID=209247 RepID=UPI001E5FAFDA|nr:nucleotide exchange factor GrpE [Nocardia yamanashiensis]UGT42251.1 nucleotide exchange factor GrpE [Nocardia yamanashiensis]
MTDSPATDQRAEPAPADPAMLGAAVDRMSERIDDLTRLLSRQAATVERLAEAYLNRTEGGVPGENAGPATPVEVNPGTVAAVRSVPEPSTSESGSPRGAAGAAAELAAAPSGETDEPLIRDLFALHALAQTFVTTTESDADRPGFEAITRRVERMLTDRGGQLVTPFRGAPFDPETMQAVELSDTDDPEADRTVGSVIQPGLTVGTLSLRPAKVVIRRYRRPMTRYSA